MVVIVVTGGIGSGKGEVARLFAERGAIVLDADVIARAVLAAPGPVRDRVAEAFGEGVVAPDGSIDRAALARAAFADDESVRKLDAIVHPAVLRELTNGLRDLQLLERPPRVVVIDVPLLAEAPAIAELADAVLALEAPVETRVARCVARGMDEADVRARVARQATDAERAELADAVLVNDGDLEALRRGVEAFWEAEVAPLAS